MTDSANATIPNRLTRVRLDLNDCRVSLKQWPGGEDSYPLYLAIEALMHAVAMSAQVVEDQQS